MSMFKIQGRNTAAINFGSPCSLQYTVSRNWYNAMKINHQTDVPRFELGCGRPNEQQTTCHTGQTLGK